MRKRKHSAAAELIGAFVSLVLLTLVYFWQTKEDANSNSALFLVLAIGLLAAVLGVTILAHVLKERRFKALRIADIDTMDGLRFEQYVAKLFQHRGFQVKVTRASGDLGVDIVARSRDHSYAVQVKRLSKGVSRRAVSDAVAGKSHYGCDTAMVVTNNYFTDGAKELAKSTKCELVDRDILADWITEYASSAPSS